MPANPGFQVSVDVKGRTCLVLGGNEEATERVHRLLEAGARVTVISPTLNDTLRKLTASGKILHRPRSYRATDTAGVVLVINTLRDDTELARSLYDQARTERFLLCSTDHPQLSTVVIPALVSRGHLRVAVSTSGTAPALASRLRQDLEQLFDDEFRAFLEWLATLREELLKAESDVEQRQEQLREAVNGFRLTGKLDYPKAWLEARGR